MVRFLQTLRTYLMHSASCANCGSCSIYIGDGKTFTCMDCHYTWTAG